MHYLYPNQIIYLQKEIIKETGGSHGVRDKGLMESAVFRPQASFGGQDLYPELFLKVAVMGHSLIQNHAFVDGNKRVGYEAMRLMLRLNGHDIKASTDKKYDFVMAIAQKKMNEQAIAEWLREHCEELK